MKLIHNKDNKKLKHTLGIMPMIQAMHEVLGDDQKLAINWCDTNGPYEENNMNSVTAMKTILLSVIILLSLFYFR